MFLHRSDLNIPAEVRRFFSDRFWKFCKNYIFYPAAQRALARSLRRWCNIDHCLSAVLNVFRTALSTSSRQQLHTFEYWGMQRFQNSRGLCIGRLAPEMKRLMQLDSTHSRFINFLQIVAVVGSSYAEMHLFVFAHKIEPLTPTPQVSMT